MTKGKQTNAVPQASKATPCMEGRQSRPGTAVEPARAMMVWMPPSKGIIMCQGDVIGTSQKLREHPHERSYHHRN